MSAGSGINHSEFNNSTAAGVHFLQIWILPERAAITPAYEQRGFGADGKAGKWQLVASRDGAQGSLTVHQDAKIYLANLNAGATLEFAAQPKRKFWVQIVGGETALNGTAMAAGDGAAVTDEAKLTFTGSVSTEIMLFDLA